MRPSGIPALIPALETQQRTRAQTPSIISIGFLGTCHFCFKAAGVEKYWCLGSDIPPTRPCASWLTMLRKYLLVVAWLIEDSFAAVSVILLADTHGTAGGLLFGSCIGLTFRVSSFFVVTPVYLSYHRFFWALGESSYAATDVSLRGIRIFDYYFLKRKEIAICVTIAAKYSNIPDVVTLCIHSSRLRNYRCNESAKIHTRNSIRGAAKVSSN